MNCCRKIAILTVVFFSLVMFHNRFYKGFTVLIDDLRESLNNITALPEKVSVAGLGLPEAVPGFHDIYEITERIKVLGIQEIAVHPKIRRDKQKLQRLTELFLPGHIVAESEYLLLHKVHKVPRGAEIVDASSHFRLVRLPVSGK